MTSTTQKKTFYSIRLLLQYWKFLQNPESRLNTLWPFYSDSWKKTDIIVPLNREINKQELYVNILDFFRQITLILFFHKKGRYFLISYIWTINTYIYQFWPWKKIPRQLQTNSFTPMFPKGFRKTVTCKKKN